MEANGDFPGTNKPVILLTDEAVPGESDDAGKADTLDDAPPERRLLRRPSDDPGGGDIDPEGGSIGGYNLSSSSGTGLGFILTCGYLALCR